MKLLNVFYCISEEVCPLSLPVLWFVTTILFFHDDDLLLLFALKMEDGHFEKVLLFVLQLVDVAFDWKQQQQKHHATCCRTHTACTPVVCAGRSIGLIVNYEYEKKWIVFALKMFWDVQRQKIILVECKYSRLRPFLSAQGAIFLLFDFKSNWLHCKLQKKKKA